MKLRYFIELVILGSLWGSSFLVTRISVDELGPVVLTMLRSFVASIALAPLLFAGGHWQSFRQNWFHIFVIGIISTALPFICLSTATLYSTAGFASILNSLVPLFTAIIAWFWLKETLPMSAIVGILLGFAGVVVMLADTQSISSGFFLLPVLAGMGAALFYALNGIYTRRFVREVSPVALAAGCQFFACLFLLPMAWADWPDQPVSLNAWLCMVYLGVICTGVAFIIYFRLLRNAGVANTALVTYLVPVFAMLFGAVFIGETITLPMIAGAAFILTGIALTTGLIYRVLPKPAPEGS